jgi:hypothetical protein
MVCHTAEGAATYAGGRPIATSIYFAQSQPLAPPAMYGVTLKAKF